MSISEICRPSPPELIQTLLAEIVACLTAAIRLRGTASLVLSGGNTPRPLFEALAQQNLPWAQITITLADERWVDTGSKDSNEAMLRQTLLCGPAAKARFIPLKNSADTACGGIATCQCALADISLPFDLIILGMGDDGHTASLFPGVSGSALDTDGTALCVSITPATAPHERISLTAAALLNSQTIFLHIVGDNKWQVYQQAKSPGAVDDMPVRTVLHQDKVPVQVFWSP
ncbi:MAG: 6-phosphogluconolactonase [Gammaproteobacteria bacterium]|nr:6-phosphogluconolactonase [Gammaproteobacteria bacterium]